MLRPPPPEPARRGCLRRLAATGLAALSWPARAVDPPTGAVVLTITGKIDLPNAQRVAQFDMAMLEKMPQAGFATRTPWYARPRHFSGPLLRDLLAAVGAHGQTVRAGALNDFRVDIPVEDARRYDVIVARLLDERPMAVRDKGPLFIIYPFDRHPELRNAVYFNRCAWQLRSMELL